MITINVFTPTNVLSADMSKKVAAFLFQHLDEYGDELAAIEKAILYTKAANSPGGYVFVVEESSEIVAAAVVNKTGMQAYIPENILVYIATHKHYRGKGIGKKLMQKILTTVEGDVALHVEPQNPAKKLYEQFGFANKYLEMRFVNKK